MTLTLWTFQMNSTSPTFNVADLYNYYPPEAGDEQLRAIATQVGLPDVAHSSNLTSLILRWLELWFWTSNGPTQLLLWISAHTMRV